MDKKYKVNELFYTLQGEGYWTGTPSVFVRFSGCDLRCPFCDTQHERGRWLTLTELVAAVATYPAPHVVLTGGEPALTADAALVAALHEAGKYVAMETNGTHEPPVDLDWLTLSPKDGLVADATPVVRRCDELKLVFTGATVDPHSAIAATWRYLQPCDTGNAAQNRRLVAQAVAYVKAHPAWRLSLQTHKFIGIP